MGIKAKAVDQEVYEKTLKREEITPPNHEALTFVVTRQYGDKDEPTLHETEEDLIEVRGFHVEPARVTVALGRTINMGAKTFESARIDVTVSVPCYREEIEEAYDYARTFAKDKISEQVGRIRKHLEEKYGGG